jgi:hypothetical protein
MNNLNNIYESFESSESFNLPDEDSNKLDTSNKRYKGKTVVLVDSENPWYQNDSTVPMEYKNTQLFYEDKNIYKQNLFKPYGRADSCIKYDLCKSNLDLGYSQLGRDIQSKKLCESNNVENFDTYATFITSDSTDTMNRNILIFIFIILVSIIIYNKYKTKS